MPTYPVKNLKTGEQKELYMTMKEYMTWKEENPDWDKDWSKGCAGAGEVGGGAACHHYCYRRQRPAAAAVFGIAAAACEA